MEKTDDGYTFINKAVILACARQAILMSGTYGKREEKMIKELWSKYHTGSIYSIEIRFTNLGNVHELVYDSRLYYTHQSIDSLNWQSYNACIRFILM